MRKLLGLFLVVAISGCATRPTSAVVEVPSHITPDLAQGLAQIGRVVAPPPTEKLYAPLHEREPYAGVQVRRDVRYGADARHLLDVFQSGAPQTGKPVLVFVHGGAFMRGERRTGTQLCAQSCDPFAEAARGRRCEHAAQAASNEAA